MTIFEQRTRSHSAAPGKTRKPGFPTPRRPFDRVAYSAALEILG